MKTKVKYELTEMKEAHRYWFSREFTDIDEGVKRKVLVALEKGGLQGPDIVSGLPWNVSVEDRGTEQTWKLILMKVNDEDKLVFERLMKTQEGIKGEIFNLAYLPAWVVDEIDQVSEQMEDRDFDGGINFLSNLVKKIVQEKSAARAALSAEVRQLSIPGLCYILTKTNGDQRGSFREVARFSEIEMLTGYNFVGRQVNHSMSTYGTLRGLHVEPWAKLVTVISGFAVSVFLDCRPSSKTFGKMEMVFLGYGKTPDGKEIQGGAVFIEPGIANSILTLSDKLDYNYVVDDIWTPGTAVYGVNPMDPALGIDWGKYVPMDKIIRSERDMNAGSFKQLTELMKKK